MRRVTTVAVLLTLAALPARAGEANDALAAWPEAARLAQTSYEASLKVVPHPHRLRRWHDLFCQEAHPAGTDADLRTIERMAAAFREMGLETVRHDVWAYLPRFESAHVAIVEGDMVRALELLERPVAEDASVATSVPPAFNAYSASGQARGPVVYANYGTREDFATLAAQEVSLKGCIVVARYGRNYRGYKAKYAEAAGAAGLLIYTDPEDSGYGRGLPYPEGGYANESYIQRGSIKTLAYPGDPLTPFEPATETAERLDPERVALPRIPVQPLGWKAAAEILSRMRGPPVSGAWQGGLPFRYRITGGPDLEVRMDVRQPRAITRTANVIGTLRGERFPEQKIVVGCHLDAWTFGAGDPHAGSIVLFEMARSFAEAARAGRRPARTIVFANWAAEEYGIIGSTEWCEAHRDDLLQNGVAYVNLDMAAMGTRFHASAAPLLKGVVADAARAVPDPRATGTGRPSSVYAAWCARGEGEARFGDLGGGSDHVGFYCHLGIPSCSLGAGGSKGVSYHSAYDTLAWYRKVVGGDYEGARVLAQVGNVLVARLANAPLVPYDLARYGSDFERHAARVGERAAARGVPLPASGLLARVAGWGRRAARVQGALEGAVAKGTLSGARLARANEILIGLERAWLLPRGLPGRPWYRNAFAASDPYSGYAAWMLPLLHHAVEGDGPVTPATAIAGYDHLLEELEQRLAQLEEQLASGG
jgi:N-acetylated-alpha-linked acidic dipeptidase